MWLTHYIQLKLLKGAGVGVPVASNVIHYAFEVDVSDNTTVNESKQIGLFFDALLNGGSGGNAFRWVTERPDYDGSTVVPTGEISTVNAIKWGESIITELRDFGDPVRMINPNVGGGYGSLSSFRISVDNVEIEEGEYSGQMLNDVIDDNELNMINRKARVYVIIDNVFFNVWSGVVSKTSHNERKFTIDCEDDFKNVHKVIPPQTANEDQFPNILKKSISKPIPVAFGYVNNAKLLNIRVRNEPIDIFTDNNGIQRKVARLLFYNEIKDSDDNVLFVSTIIDSGSKIIKSNELAGLFLRFILDGGEDDAFKVQSNGNSSTNDNGTQSTSVILDKEIEDSETLVIPDPNILTPIEVGTWVELFDFESTYIVSNNEVTEFSTSEIGAPKKITFYDKDQAEHIDVSEVLELSSLVNIENTNYPGITAFTDVIDHEGNFFKLFPFQPDKVVVADTLASGSIISQDFGATGDELPNLIDHARLTKNTITFEQTTPGFNSFFQILLEVHLPKEIKNAKFEKFYMLVDYDVTAQNASVSAQQQGITFKPFDIADREVDRYKNAAINPGLNLVNKEFTAGETEELRLIPANYFSEAGGSTTLFGAKRFELDLSGLYDGTNVFRAVPKIQTFIKGGNDSSTIPNQITLDVFQICFAGEKEINIINDDIFIKTIGEKISGNTTDNVFHIFQSILETYDGISASDLDLSSMTSRLTWTAGRQLTERKTSFEYLKELARQSFVGIFPSRTGKRKFVAYRDFTTVTQAFSTTNGNVLEDSIQDIRLSPINEVFNEFDIKYEYIEAGRRFEKSVFVKKPDESAFPDKFVSTDAANDLQISTHTSITITIQADGAAFASMLYASVPSVFAVGVSVSLDDITGIGQFSFGEIIEIDGLTVNVKFKNQFGLTNGDTTSTGSVFKQGSSVPEWTTFVGGFSHYNTALSLWTACRNSFLKTLVVRPLPDNFANCKWYVDATEFGIIEGDNGSPQKYLMELVEWATRQKEIAPFAVPMTTTFVQLELLPFVTFKDIKFTNNELREGYISKIKINPSGQRILLELTLIPSDIDDITSCKIIESGNQPDQIIESGSQPDQIIESGNC